MFVDVLFQKAKAMGKKHILLIKKIISDFNNKNTFKYCVMLRDSYFVHWYFNNPNKFYYFPPILLLLSFLFCF